jgi:UDP-N-acetylglucosamine 4,6-dehydratase/5-epimerase
LCSDKLFAAANNFRGPRDLRFCAVRYGNVMGSRGSVVPYFIAAARTGVLPITDPAMTRFNIVLEEAVDLVLWGLENGQGGEIFVAKCPSYRLADLAQAVGPNCSLEVIGRRPGEKMHEDMITESDSLSTIDVGKYYAILPVNRSADAGLYGDAVASPVAPGFSYNSGRNTSYLSVDELRVLIKQHVDPHFQPV